MTLTTRGRQLATAVHARTVRRWAAGPAHHDDRGQATTEYGLVILVAGTIALGIIAWAGQTGAFQDLFENVLGRLVDG